MASQKKRKTIEILWESISRVKEKVGTAITRCGVSRIVGVKPENQESRDIFI